MLTKEQYFGMYIGVDILSPDEPREKLIGVCKDEVFGLPKFDGSYNLDDCKLILRPISEMTEEENKRYVELWHKEYVGEEKRPMIFSETSEYLISIGIDIFGLKEKGYAIYKSDLEENKK